MSRCHWKKRCTPPKCGGYWILSSLLRHAHIYPADLHTALALADSAPEGLGSELRAQADPQNELALLGSLLNEIHLLKQIRMLGRVEDTCLSAKHDQSGLCLNSVRDRCPLLYQPDVQRQSGCASSIGKKSSRRIGVVLDDKDAGQLDCLQGEQSEEATTIRSVGPRG